MAPAQKPVTQDGTLQISSDTPPAYLDFNRTKTVMDRDVCWAAIWSGFGTPRWITPKEQDYLGPGFSSAASTTATLLQNPPSPEDSRTIPATADARMSCNCKVFARLTARASHKVVPHAID